MRTNETTPLLTRQVAVLETAIAIRQVRRLSVAGCAAAVSALVFGVLPATIVAFPEQASAQGHRNNQSVFGPREEALGERARRARRNASRQRAHRAQRAGQIRLPRHYASHRRLGWVAAVPPRGVRRVHNRVVYYYYRGRYYWPSDNGYSMFTSPPAGGLRQVEDLGAWPDMPELKVIAPGNFSESEHINANAQCHYIATDQTGFDPTRAGGGVADNEYRRLKKRYLDSITQCLIDRGYERG